MATILVVLLVGISLTALVLSAAAGLRNSQEQSLTAHAQLEAQLKAWSGVEVVRTYLQALNEDSKLKELARAVDSSGGTYALTLSGLSNVSATLTKVDSISAPTHFTAQITGTSAAGTRAQSTSTVQVVYQTSPSVGKNLNFGDSLRVDGNVQFRITSGEKYSLNIVGDFVSRSDNLSGIGYVNATGSIDVGSGNEFDTLQSNCDVRLSGDASAVSVKAMRNVCLGSASDGGASVTGVTTANGVVVSFVTTGYILKARGDDTSSLSCVSSMASTCDVSNAGNSAVYIPKNTYTAKVEALTNVSYEGVVLDRIDARGNLYAADSSTVNAGEIGGALTNLSNRRANVSIVENKRVNITAVTALVPGENALDTTDFDQRSNYAFKFDINGNRKVTVRNVSGLDTGREYFVGKNNGNAEQKRGDWVCLALSSQDSAAPICTIPIKKICRTSGEGSCFAGSTAATAETRAKWKLKATTHDNVVGMAPGILWFDGDLTLGGGTFYNSLLATGNIKVTSSIKVVAPNYAGYSGYRDSAPVGICNSTFDSAGDATNANTLVPIELCNTNERTYNAKAYSGLGNYALMAGSKTTTAGSTTYVGGNITTGSTSDIFGNVRAGNELQTSGNTSISGSISALGLGAATANRNLLSGSTKINLMDLPTTLSTNDTCAVCKQESRGSTRIKWTKYL